MAKITIDITAREKRIIEALADAEGQTIEELFRPYLDDLTENKAGIRSGLPGAVQDSIADDLVSKAGIKKAAREAAAGA